MPRIKSSLPNMVMSLSFISLGMAAAPGLVNNVTKGPIEVANQKKVVDAIAKVVPEFNNDPVKEVTKVAEGKDTVYFYPAKKDGELVGTAVRTFTQKGFSGFIGIMVGFLPDGTIFNSEVLDQKETPGLGTLMADAKFKDANFNGKNPASFKLQVKKDGGDVDAITAATITSRAYCDAIQRAYDLLMKQGSGGTDSAGTAEIKDSCDIESIDQFDDVLPAFNNDPMQEMLVVEGLELFAARQNKKLVGVAVKSFAKGYNENIWILTGFLPDGTIHKVKVLRHKESKGKGSQVCEPWFLDQFKGKHPEKFSLKIKTEGGDVDVISSCTISVNAICKAVESGFQAFKKGGVK